MFHCRRWSGNRETAEHRAMIRNIPIGDRSAFNNIIRITSNYQVQNMSLNMRKEVNFLGLKRVKFVKMKKIKI